VSFSDAVGATGANSATSASNAANPSYTGAGGNVGAVAGQGTVTTAQATHSFTRNVLKNFTNNLVSSGIDAALNGKPYNADTIAGSLKNALLTAGMAEGANTIGDAKAAGDLDAFTHKVAHAVLGCAAGAAMSNDGCAAGAAHPKPAPASTSPRI
jgi:hypothetical protein